MAITRLQSKTVYPGNQIVFDSDNAAGSLLIAFAVYSEISSDGAFSDTNGNTWTNISSALYSGSGSPVMVDIAYAFNCNPGANTINYTPGLTDIGISAFEYSGVMLSGNPSVTDTTASGTNTASPTSSAIAGVGAGVLAMAIFGSESQAQTTITADSPFTVRESSPSHAHAVADYVTLTNGETLQPSFNLNNSDENWIIRMILLDPIRNRLMKYTDGKLLVVNGKIVTITA